MAFQLSPGVAISEKDFTSIAPTVSTSVGAYAGAFQWGPVLSPVTVTSEDVLVQQFWKPSDSNFDSFFTVANFLAYSNNIFVTRADTTDAKNAVAITTGSVTSISMGNNGSGYVFPGPNVSFAAPDVSGGVQATGTPILSGGAVTAIAVGDGGSGYTITAPDVIIAAPDVSGGVQAVAHATIAGGLVNLIVIDTPGSGYTIAPVITLSGGNGSNATIGSITVGTSSITGINIIIAGSGYSVAPLITISAGGGTAAAATCAITVAGLKINNVDDYTSTYINGAGVVGEFAAKYPGALGNSLKVSFADSTSYATWEYKDEFDSVPATSPYVANIGGGNDELHIIVVDEDGKWTGTSGTILEKFAFVSKASDCKKYDGTNNYYKNVINRSSQYIWWMDHTVLGTSGAAWGTVATATAYKSMTASDVTISLAGGVDDLEPSAGQLMAAWELYADDSRYDISLLPIGKASTTIATYIINNIAEVRLDCVVFLSPEDTISGEVIIGTGSAATDSIKLYRDDLPSTSYAVIDSGYKYQYDRYNDVYRWIPLNGDIAGLCARTDFQNDPWWSPGGLNRGQIKNVVKLACNLTKVDRDNLYKDGINPVVAFPGQGTVLFGDKTMLAKPSAFDRINVRRLFIVLEKTIATAAKFQLFEFNDAFTRSQFKNLVEPFLRGVQGRRGITEFLVKCDDTNNTSQIIDSNQFIADIYVKPNHSINFITLNFIASRTGISFSELGA